MSTSIQVGRAYRIYGKMEGMKSFKPVSRDTFTDRLIYADIVSVQNEEDKEKVKRALDFLNTQGEFELRLVPGWKVK